MDELLADFVAETREMMEAVSGELVAWEADPADGARLDSIFRFVHTVKGNCGFFDFPRLARLSHAAEDALAECRAGRREPDRALVNAVLAVVDRIGAMTAAIEAGEELASGDDDALIAALDGAGIGDAMEPSGKGQKPDAIAEDGHRSSKAALQRTIRLPVSLLDEVMSGVSDMVLARNDLARRLRESGEQPDIDGPFERLSGILADVRSAITRMRMQRLEILFGSLPRLVRDLSAELGKQVMVDFEGGDVELDREMVEMVRDPLTHIIRNAIDHGIEAPAQRLVSGKREIGVLRFAARQSGNRISLMIADDGQGVDGERLAAKAVAAGLHSAAEAARMSSRDRLLLMFEPGLSTAAQVSNVSGRGVGMDVVRSNIEAVGGSIDVDSVPGEGTTFHLQLPLTLSIIAALTVEVGGQLYAIPRNYVEEVTIVEPGSDQLAGAGERLLLTFRGRRIPCLALRSVLGLAESDASGPAGRTLLLLRLANDETFALGVDRVLGHEDVVVKPIPPAIMDTRLYGGTTLLDDGRPIMLLDIPSIATLHGLGGDVRARAARIEADEAPDMAKAPVPIMLFTALDGRKRAIRLETVRRIETVEHTAIDTDGDRAQAIVGDGIFALAGHDLGPVPQGRCRLLRLGDGDRELAYIVRDVIDTGAIAGDLTATAGESGLEGVALVGGEMVPLLDAYYLFAKLPAAPSQVDPPVCRIPEGNEWARTILAPLVAAAGYTVASDSRAPADVAIVFADEAPSEPCSARATIRISTAPADQTGAIYRYDREALLGALRQAAWGGGK